MTLHWGVIDECVQWSEDVGVVFLYLPLHIFWFQTKKALTPILALTKIHKTLSLSLSLMLVTMSFNMLYSYWVAWKCCIKNVSMILLLIQMLVFFSWYILLRTLSLLKSQMKMYVLHDRPLRSYLCKYLLKMSSRFYDRFKFFVFFHDIVY